MAYMNNKKYVKKKKSCRVQTLTYHKAARLLVHREFRKGSLPGFVQRGGDQKAAEFISCWLFHIPFHPTYSHPFPRLTLFLWTQDCGHGNFQVCFDCFFFFSNPVFTSNQWKKKWLGYSFAEWIVSSFITSATGGLSAPIKATIHFYFSLPDNIQVWKESRSANYIFI